MEVLDSDSTDPLHWDTKLSELNLSPGNCEAFYTTHFTEMLDEFSKDMLGHLFNDPFLSDKSELMDAELSPAPHIQAEHSYSLAGDSRPQSPLTQISTEDDFSEDMECESWSVSSDLKPTTLKHEALLCDSNCLAPSVTLTTAATSMVVDTALDTYKANTAPVIEPALGTVLNVQPKIESYFNIKILEIKAGIKDLTMKLNLMKTVTLLSNEEQPTSRFTKKAALKSAIQPIGTKPTETIATCVRMSAVDACASLTKREPFLHENSELIKTYLNNVFSLSHLEVGSANESTNLSMTETQMLYNGLSARSYEAILIFRFVT